MAVGKNKGLTKSGKKGMKKKLIDPFTRKDWYDVKAPAVFMNRNVGKTLVNRTQGTRIASEALKGRVFEVSLADLQEEIGKEDGLDEGLDSLLKKPIRDTSSFRKFRLIAEEVQGRNVLTNFHGMSMVTDKLKALVRKWQTLIEAHVDVKTTDGYLLRLFCIGFTKRHPDQVSKACYAQRAKIRKIRQVMVQMMTSEVSEGSLRVVVSKLIPDSIGADIEKRCDKIFPLHDVCIRKVKVLKKPKFDLGRLLEFHTADDKTPATGVRKVLFPAKTDQGERWGDDLGVRIDRPAARTDQNEGWGDDLGVRIDRPAARTDQDEGWD